MSLAAVIISLAPQTAATMSSRRRSQIGAVGNENEARKLDKLVEGIKGKAPPQLVSVLKALAPLIKMAFTFLSIVGPYILKFYMLLYAVYKKLPHNVVKMLLGLAFTFFGGMFAGQCCMSHALASHIEIV